MPTSQFFPNFGDSLLGDRPIRAVSEAILARVQWHGNVGVAPDRSAHGVASPTPLPGRPESPHAGIFLCTGGNHAPFLSTSALGHPRAFARHLRAVTQVPYSDFLKALDAGRVAEVRVTEEDLHFKLNSGEDKFRLQECRLPLHLRLHVSGQLRSSADASTCTHTHTADFRTPTNAQALERMHTRAEMGSTTQVTAPPELVNKMVAKGVRFAQTESISSDILPLLNPVLYAVTGIGLASACQSLPVCPFQSLPVCPWYSV